jgi:hypothetical protein
MPVCWSGRVRVAQRYANPAPESRGALLECRAELEAPMHNIVKRTTLIVRDAGRSLRF